MTMTEQVGQDHAELMKACDDLSDWIEDGGRFPDIDEYAAVCKLVEAMPILLDKLSDVNRREAAG